MTCRSICHRNSEARQSLNGGFTARKLEIGLTRLGQLETVAVSTY